MTPAHLPLRAKPTDAHAAGPRPRRLDIRRIGLYAFAILSAVWFLLPFWVMVVTSLKSMEEIGTGDMLAWPSAPTLDYWKEAWSGACTGVECNGISVGFLNSVIILVPSVIGSIAVGAITGYAMSFWKPRGASFVFGVLMLGAFIPYQVFLYPLTRQLGALGLFGSLWGLVSVHIIFGLPLMTLLFRNFYSALPLELFKAARVDGAGFWAIFVYIALPMSGPIVVVAAILQVTGVWNDYLLGLIFGGTQWSPMTVQLNNIVNTVMGERRYNVDMAATILTALLPLTLYLVSGRLFVRGIAAGAVKG